MSGASSRWSGHPPSPSPPSFSVLPADAATSTATRCIMTRPSGSALRHTGLASSQGRGGGPRNTVVGRASREGDFGRYLHKAFNWT